MALVVGRVQPVENVAGHLVLQQGQHQGVKLLVPLLGGPLGAAQGQLLWRTETKFCEAARLQAAVSFIVAAQLVSLPSSMTIFNTRY